MPVNRGVRCTNSESFNGLPTAPRRSKRGFDGERNTEASMTLKAKRLDTPPNLLIFDGTFDPDTENPPMQTSSKRARSLIAAVDTGPSPQGAKDHKTDSVTKPRRHFEVSEDQVHVHSDIDREYDRAVPNPQGYNENDSQERPKKNTTVRKRRGREEEEEDVTEVQKKAATLVNVNQGKRKTSRKRNTRVRKPDLGNVDAAMKPHLKEPTSKKETRKPTSTKEVEEIETLTANANSQGGEPESILPHNSESKKKRKRKTREEKEAEAMPLAARTQGLKMFVGAHVSIAKGIQNAVTNCVHIGGNAFALFLQSQRKWENPPLLDENRDLFHSSCKDHSFDQASHVLPHGSYLVNLAQEDKIKATQAYDFFLGDLKRCEVLGIKLYNFHPGACGGTPLPNAITRLATQLNRVLKETKFVTPVLENMAGSGSVIGSRFSDLRDVIAQIKPEYKSRIGVCLDTCHAFAAGYDLRTPSSFRAVLQDFDDTIGLSYLKGLHINDSKAPFNSKRDLHQNIGLGFLGLRAFHNVMNEPRFQNLPLVLETPCDRPDPEDPSGKKMIDDKNIWANEIKLLESLIGMDAEGQEFRKLEAELSEQGREARDKMQKQFEALQEKKRKKVEKGQQTLLAMMTGGKARVTRDSIASLSSSELSELEDEDVE